MEQGEAMQDLAADQRWYRYLSTPFRDRYGRPTGPRRLAVTTLLVGVLVTMTGLISVVLFAEWVLVPHAF